MQSVFVIITKLIASKKYFCKEVFCNNFGRDGTEKLQKSPPPTSPPQEKQERALCGPTPVSRPKLSENFEGHWSITFSWGNFIWTTHWSIPFTGEISYGPLIGPYLFLGKFIWTNGPESSSKVSPYTGIGPWMALPRKGQKLWKKRSEIAIFEQFSPMVRVGIY